MIFRPDPKNLKTGSATMQPLPGAKHVNCSGCLQYNPASRPPSMYANLGLSRTNILSLGLRLPWLGTSFYPFIIREAAQK